MEGDERLGEKGFSNSGHVSVILAEVRGNQPYDDAAEKDKVRAAKDKSAYEAGGGGGGGGATTKKPSSSKKVTKAEVLVGCPCDTYGDQADDDQGRKRMTTTRMTSDSCTGCFALICFRYPYRVILTTQAHLLPSPVC